MNGSATHKKSGHKRPDFFIHFRSAMQLFRFLNHRLRRRNSRLAAG